MSDEAAVADPALIAHVVLNSLHVTDAPEPRHAIRNFACRALRLAVCSVDIDCESSLTKGSKLGEFACFKSHG